MFFRLSILLPALVAFAFGPLLDARAQPAGKHAQTGYKWWSPVAAARGQGPPARTRPGPLVPKGHLPPPGHCRLWYPGQPPGQQPPPMSCREAYRQQSGRAFVVSHRGAAGSGPPGRAPEWRHRPAGDIVLRRPPRKEGTVFDVDIIIDVIGRRGYRRLQARKRRHEVRGALKARCVSIGPSGGSVIQVRAGPYPLAELVDQNGDGRVESMLFRERR